MKRLPVLLALLCTFSIVPVSANSQTPQKPDRQVAITIDDLPAGMADRLPAADITAMTAKLLGTLRDQKIPVVGFVNEKKLYKTGEVDDASRHSRCGLTMASNWGTTPSATRR